MKVLVAIKQVIDHNIKVKIKNDFSSIDKTNIKMSINPFDEVALEEAIRLKEKGKIKKIISISCGDITCKEILRKSMAMGIDKSILIENTEKLDLQPLDIAKILRNIINKKKDIKLVFLGKQSIDYDYNQTGQMLAGLLNWPQATFVSNIKLKNGGVYVTRETDYGIEKLFLTLPAVITVDLRLNEPRYVTIINLIQSKKKNIHTIKLNSLNINFNNNIKVIKMSKSITKNTGVKIINVNSFLKIIKEFIK